MVDEVITSEQSSVLGVPVEVPGAPASALVQQTASNTGNAVTDDSTDDEIDFDKIKTKDVFDAYFASMSPESAYKRRGQLDREEIYEYEEQLGKSIFDMDSDELFGLLATFRTRSGHKISYNSLNQFATSYRQIWNFYIRHYKVVLNPWNYDNMRGHVLYERVSEISDKITTDTLKHVLQLIDAEYCDSEYSFFGDYLKCLLLLYYNGFYKSSEIMLVKAKDVDYKNKSVRTDRTTVHLSDECFRYFTTIHNSNVLVGKTGTYVLAPYHDSYFKINIRQSSLEKFNEKTIDEVSVMMNRKITMYVNRKFKVNLNYRNLFLLGFYNYIVAQCGEEHTKELINAVRDDEKSAELMQYAKDYGVTIDGANYIRKYLLPYSM